MRIGDFAVEVVPRGKGVGVREISSGHVLARAGQVYALRLRNFGPLRCVAAVRIDGRAVTAGGLVIEPRCTEELERPISPDEDGCFTVVAEGDERVFGPDGGRDNPDLGLIEVRFRRELPGGPERPRPLPPSLLEPLERPPSPAMPQPDRPRPEVFPIWNAAASRQSAPNGKDRFGGQLPGIIARSFERAATPEIEEPTLDDVERAAGTGLTGHSAQRFRPTQLGPLETEATLIQLRLVIASADVIASTAPHSPEVEAPARPAARP
jgi:hypothetical protein